MTRRDIEFDAEGVTLRGWFYPAEGASGPAPTVVMAHGFSAVKEMYLDSFAEVFAAAGLNALVFDNRCFGASAANPARRSTRGRRSGTTGMPSPTPSPSRRSIPAGSGSGAAATPAATSWSSPRSTAGSRRSCARCRSSAATTTCGPWSGPTSSPGSVRCSTPTGWPASTGSRRPWSRWSTRTAGPVGAADRGLVGVVQRDRQHPGTGLAQRGDAAQRGAVHRIRAGRLPALDQSHAAADAGGRRRPPGALRTRYRGLRHGAPAQGAGHPAGRSFRRLRQGVRPRQRAGA